MKFSVYHSKCMVKSQIYQTAVFPTDYYLVATVDCENLDEAFKLTNYFPCFDNGFRRWWKNERVTPHFTEPRCLLEDDSCRPTTVGDCIVKPDGSVHRVFLMVDDVRHINLDGFGFTHLNNNNNNTTKESQ
jgi:hypothetical protein